MLRWMICAALAVFGSSAVAQERTPAEMTRDAAFMETQVVRLWPGRAPGATADTPDQIPTMTVYRPQKGRANGAAVVVAPGGGYIELAGNIEGRQVADWFASRGVTAFVLRYRYGPAARLPIPLLDGARAIRSIRADAATYGIDPTRVGMIGFSAGGHLSAMTAATADAGQAGAADAVDRQSSRPDFLVLGYPWLEATVIDAQGHSPYCTFAGKGCDPAAYARFLPAAAVTRAMPPTFIYHTSSDSVVRADGILRFYTALQAKGVSAELHVFAVGEHGTGLGGSDPALARWPDLMEHWLRALGIFKPRG